MPDSELLDTSLALSLPNKESTGSTIFASQSRRTAMHSTASQESAAITTQQRASSTRRSTRYSRLSDRWPVLNKIIRTSKSTAVSKDQPRPHIDDKDALSDDEEEGDAVIVQPIAMRNMASLSYQQRVMHPASPKFPSPLSGARPAKRLLLMRHNYPHRGYSQSALHHRRELCRKRKCEWDDYEYTLWQAGVSVEEAYGGMVQDINGSSHALPPHLKNGPWHKKSNLVSQPAREAILRTPVLVNPAIFPRLGDLCSARDPFLISVDTWFADFPLWTLSKLIWLYDVNYRAGIIGKQCKPMQLDSSFIEDFDVGDSSADTLSTSYTNASDTTLVSRVVVTSHSPKDKTNAPVHCKNRCGTTLPSSASLDSVISSHCRRPWETCWFSRWEVLYNQIGFAADIAASLGDPLLCANASKEAARVILTTAGVLYDPHHNKVNGRETNNQRQTSAESTGSELHHVVSMEDDEEDYGEVICSPESAHRLGAQVDPFSMFATATTEYLDPFLTSATSSGDSDPVASHFSRDYASEIAGGLQQLTLCC